MFVYKQYDQDALDRQFNNRLNVPDFDDYFRRWEQLSKEAGENFPVVKDVQYGPLQRERLDIFPSILPLSKTLVFIHGGYWQMFDKALFHFIANGFHSCGITIAIVNYPLAPDVSMVQIVKSARNAISWLYTNISQYNGNPNQIYVCGHSAGGHLAAMMMATNWRLVHAALPDNLVKGVCAISGLFNLFPVQLCYLNKVLNMDEEAAFINSPVLLEPSNACPLIVAAGGAETAEFNDQSKDLYEAWQNKGFDLQLLPLPGLHHFSIIESIIYPGSGLHNAMLQLMDGQPDNSIASADKGSA